MLFIEYPKCSTCQKAKKWLETNGVAFEDRHIKENNPTIEELKAWHEKSGLPLKRFFNTSGMLYRELQLKDKLPTMSEEEQFELLASDGNGCNIVDSSYFYNNRLFIFRGFFQ